MDALQIKRKVSDPSALEAAKRRLESRLCWAGRYLEQLSGVCLVIVALTLVFGTVETTLIDDTKLILEAEFIGYILAILGVCQVVYHHLHQRRLFNMVACSAWATIVLSSFIHLGEWNILAALAMPFALYTFYLFGYQAGLADRKEK